MEFMVQGWRTTTGGNRGLGMQLHCKRRYRTLPGVDSVQLGNGRFVGMPLGEGFLLGLSRARVYSLQCQAKPAFLHPGDDALKKVRHLHLGRSARLFNPNTPP